MDLFLDSRPYGAHTVSADALWTATPVLTLPGAPFASRVAASLYTAAGKANAAKAIAKEATKEAGPTAAGPEEVAAAAKASGRGGAAAAAAAAAASVLVARSRLEFVDTAVALCASPRALPATPPAAAAAAAAPTAAATEGAGGSGRLVAGLRAALATGVAPTRGHLQAVSGNSSGGGEGGVLFNSAAFALGLTRAYEAMAEVKAVAGAVGNAKGALPHLFFAR